jgi:hypothetical protein
MIAHARHACFALPEHARSVRTSSSLRLIGSRLIHAHRAREGSVLSGRKLEIHYSTLLLPQQINFKFVIIAGWQDRTFQDQQDDRGYCKRLDLHRGVLQAPRLAVGSGRDPLLLRRKQVARPNTGGDGNER